MKMPSHKTWKVFLPFLAIGIIILIFNALSIWGFDGLFSDDRAYYYKFFDKSVSDLTFKRNIFHAIYTLWIFKIASVSSVFFARLLIILIFSIPSAFFIYYFAHRHYRLTTPYSITIAVLPFILPNEVEVPTFIAAGYMHMAILFAMITLYFLLKFSNRTDFSVTFFLLAISFYFITTESSELFASMLPVFLFPVFILRKFSVKQLSLGFILSFIAIRKAILVIQKPHANINSLHNHISADQIKDRIVHFLDFINPIYSTNFMGSLNIIIVCIILLGAILVLINHKKLKPIIDSGPTPGKQKNKYLYFIYYYGFPLMWLFLSAAPFLLFSYFVTSRYFIVTSIALSFILVISIGVILGLFTERKMPYYIVLVLIVAYSGYYRQINFNKFYKAPKEQTISLKKALGSYSFPENSQIIIAAPVDKGFNPGNGMTLFSNGVLQQSLKRRDVTGQIMNELRFYDPFVIFKHPYLHRNTNLDTAKSTFLIRWFQKDPGKTRRLYYALRWVDDSSKSSPWTIFHFDEQGNVKNLISGNGFEYYESVVDSMSALGIRREDIMFGGLPNRNDSLRLGL